MGLLDYFRRPPPIRTASDLVDFIDAQAAFLVQKGIYEYSRARAGHYAKVLLREKSFHAAADDSRWRAYPLGLAMVGELVESVLAAERPERRTEQAAAVASMALAAFDRYPPPVAVGVGRWRGLRDELEQRLRGMALHPPKAARDISAPYAHAYFNLMPIHEKLRGQDEPTLHSYLRVTLCNIHDELSRRLDRTALTRILADAAPRAHAG